jgi:hypothetical protein
MFQRKNRSAIERLKKIETLGDVNTTRGKHVVLTPQGSALRVPDLGQSHRLNTPLIAGLEATWSRGEQE